MTKIKCNTCLELLTIFFKRKPDGKRVVTDATGRQFHGRKCPDCRSAYCYKKVKSWRAKKLKAMQKL